MEPAQLAGGVVLTVLVAAWAAWAECAVRVAWDAARRAGPRDVIVFGLVLTGALALRLVAPAVPHDLNPRSDDVLHSWRGLDWRYGHAMPALLRLVWAAGLRVDDQTVFHVTAAFGALTVPLVGLLVLRLGAGRVAAAVATVVVGGLGLHVRFSHTDAPQIPETALVVLAALALTGPPASTWRGRALAGLSLGLAGAMRPEAVVLPALVLAWVAVVRGDGVRWLVPVGALALLVALPDFGSVLAFGRPVSDPSLGFGQGHGLLTWGLGHLLPWSTPFVPAALALWLWLAPSGRPRVRVVLATAALMVAVGSLVPNDRWSIGSLESWCLARHQLRVVPWMAVLIGVGLESLVDRLVHRVPALAAPAGLLAVLGVVATTARTLPDAYADFTPAQEYTFVRAHLPDVPAGCAIVTLPMEGDRSLVLSESLKASVGTPHTWAWLDAVPADAPCVVYYRSAACTVVSFKELDVDRCASFEATHNLTPLAVGALVDRGWLFERYGGAPVRVGFYRVGSAAP